MSDPRRTNWPVMGHLVSVRVCLSDIFKLFVLQDVIYGRGIPFFIPFCLISKVIQVIADLILAKNLYCVAKIFL